MIIFETLVTGVLIGGLYALYALGLSILFGVMRLVNLAHGDFIVMAAYMGLVLVHGFGLSPMADVIFVPIIMAAIGYAAQRTLLNYTLQKDPLVSVLVTFGLSIVIQNVLLLHFSADTQKLSIGGFEVASVGVFGSTIGLFPILILVLSIVLIALLEFALTYTRSGRLIRAASDDVEVLSLMGIDPGKVRAYAGAVAFFVVGIAGVLMSIRTNFSPTDGPARLIFAFEAIIIGGLGSLWGTLAGGIILGIAQTTGSAVSPSFQILAGHIVFLLVLVLRPQGLLPKIEHR
ncbi:branched-chain amino acid ABC transporter permease [Rhizobium calliandrae]|uniref:Branched-chain amino acid ABC transporter permease n=1 Tax=Rhizobium calliandrae TaxID=1312182 RepID=A0ABT7KPH1_9HYPH|nr:branched-chain amino acid ABC transporter permease [Rhizobium calliandrae]MDL2410532.1 branched-chain amino acid ABC transporter permease [Rhizobium calliandrae]